ncbi:MAG TPA: MFS transporter [Candidatus Dormibacteraeota bacterium]|nr:MFS transporter [Candidatus Dormibacteraeota bacterium]
MLTRRRALATTLLIAAVGFQLRSVVLAVPPVLPTLRADLRLSFTQAGALTSIPVLCLGLAAVPGAFLVNRYGARSVVGLSTLGLGATALLRLAPPEPATLYVFSALMALCVAVAQPAMSVAVRVWFPDRVQQVSAVFGTALGAGGLCGATLSAGLQALAGWRGTFVVWSTVALATGLVWLVGAPAPGAGRDPEPTGLGSALADPTAWHVAGLFGFQSLVFYGSASWIPFELRGAGPGRLSLVMLLLSLSTPPLGMLLMGLRWPWARSRAFYTVAGLLATLGAAGFALGLTAQAWLWAATLGTGTAMCFLGASALPALFARPGQVAAYAALVLTVGYAISFVGPLLGGLLLDHTRAATSPFWLMTAAALALIGLGLSLPRRADGAEPAGAVHGRGPAPATRGPGAPPDGSCR